MSNPDSAPIIITYTFPRCWVHIDEAASFLHTAFDSGRILESVIDAEKDLRTAQRYGYGEDVWHLWREHDVLHHTVGTLFGQGHSPTIWSVAHPEMPGALPAWAQREEEAFIAHIHRWLNANVWHDDLCALGNFGVSVEEMQKQLRAVMAGEITNVSAMAASLPK